MRRTLKAITERKEALENELQEVIKSLEEKDAKLKGYVMANNAKVQASYYQGQYDCKIYKLFLKGVDRGFGQDAGGNFILLKAG